MKLFLFISIVLILSEKNLISAEAGMPQLDSKYWFSQSFWLILIFTALYFSIAKFFIPKIKDNLDDREKKINSDLNEAKELNELAEKKFEQYEKEINSAKKDVIKILADSKRQLDKSIQNKKEKFENEINKEIVKVEKEILDLKKSSDTSVNKMAQEISSSIIEQVTGEKLNESSINAVVTEVSKKRVIKYL